MISNEPKPDTRAATRDHVASNSTANALSSLTEREWEVLSGVIVGQSNPEIARELFVSVNTVKFHVVNILRKLRVGSRTEAAVYVASRRAQ